LNIAAAASEAIAVAPEHDRPTMAWLVKQQAQAVSTDRRASDAQKAKGELLLIKAEKILEKPTVSIPAEVMPAAVPVKFFGQEDPGKTIVFILDHSGSMLDNFAFLQQEAIRAVKHMTPEQSFGVVMVSEQASLIFPTLQRATPSVKAVFESKLSTFRAQGMNDDLLAPFQEAFQKAFAMQPDVIYFLTDGHFDHRLSDVVEKLNRAKKVRVNTMAFVNHDPSYEEQLKEMAKRNGGSYKFVSEKDLGK
jgi:hypothetical protein